MPVNYTFSSFELQDKNGYSIASQSIEPVVFAFGDYKRLILRYSRSKTGGGSVISENIYFSSQLFGDLNSVSADEGIKPASGWQAVTSGLSGAVSETAMTAYNLPDSGKNAAVSYAFSGSTLTVNLDFYAASDLRSFLSSAAISNEERLNQYSEQTGANVYESAAQQIGSYLIVEVQESTGGLNSDGAFTLRRLDGGSWPTNTTNINIILADNPVFQGSWAVASSSGFSLDLTGSGFPATAGDFGASVIYTAGGIENAETYILSQASNSSFISKGIQTDAQGFNIGSGMSAPVLSLERNALPVLDLSSIESTNYAFAVQSADLTKCKLWYFDQNAASTGAFFSEASLTDISGSIVSLGGGVFEVSGTLNAVNANASNVLLFVCYDETNNVVNSFKYNPETTAAQDLPAYPDVQTNIDDYLNQYGDYVKTAIYDRLKFSVLADKGTYNARSIVGNFDDNFNRWELQIILNGLVTKRIRSAFALSEGVVIEDTPTNYNLYYTKRMEKAWQGETVVFQWYFYFENGLQSDRIGVQQRIDVHSEAKNLLSAQIFDDSGGFLPENELANFCGDLNQTATVRTESTGDNYKQIAVLVLPEIQEEESFIGSGELPQSDGQNLLNVDEFWAGGFATAQFDLTQVTPDAIVILSKEIPEAFDFGGAVDLEYLQQNSG